MVGPFKTAQGGMMHLPVAVDKFTKWIEARAINKLDGPTAVRFIKDIAVRYGMPNSIITDDGTNFAKGALEQYCSVSDIRLDLASVAHPQSNGKVERANGAATRRATHPLTRQLARRVAGRPLESPNNAEPVDRVHPVHPRLWSRSRHPDRC